MVRDSGCYWASASMLPIFRARRFKSNILQQTFKDSMAPDWILVSVGGTLVVQTTWKSRSKRPLLEMAESFQFLCSRPMLAMTVNTCRRFDNPAVRAR